VRVEAIMTNTKTNTTVINEEEGGIENEMMMG